MNHTDAGVPIHRCLGGERDHPPVRAHPLGADETGVRFRCPVCGREGRVGGAGRGRPAAGGVRG